MKIPEVIIIFLAVMLAFAVSHADPECGTGIGVIVGEPTGISLKRWISGSHGVDAGVAWSLSGNNSLHLHADYLIHSFTLLGSDVEKGKLPVYFGVGGRIKLGDENDGKGGNNNDDLIGVRIPFGVSYLFEDAPVDIFLEVVPVLDVIPDTEFDLNGAVGARFCF